MKVLIISEKNNQDILEIFEYILKTYRPKVATILGFKEFCLKKFRHCKQKSSKELISFIPHKFRSKVFSISEFSELKVYWHLNVPIILVPKQTSAKSFGKKLGGIYCSGGIFLAESQETQLKQALTHEFIHCFLEYLFLTEEEYDESINHHPLENLYTSIRHETIAYSLSNWSNLKTASLQELTYYLTGQNEAQIQICFATQTQMFIKRYLIYAKSQITSNLNNRQNLITNCLRTPDLCQWLPRNKISNNQFKLFNLF